MLPFNNRSLTIRHNGKTFRFCPKGKIAGFPQNNPMTFFDSAVVSRLIVGLTTKDGKRKFSGQSIINACKAFFLTDTPTMSKARGMKDTYPFGGSFLYQQGIYTYTDGPMAGKTEQENSIQIIINKTTSEKTETMAKFFKLMENLAEYLREKFQQESVIVEHQFNGMTQRIGMATAE